MRRIFLPAVALMGCALISLTCSAQQRASTPPQHSQDNAEAETTVAASIPVDDQPSKEQLLQLFSVMQIRSQMESMLKRMPQAVQQQMRSEEQSLEANLSGDAKPTPEQKAALDKVTAKYMDAAFKLYPVDEMLDDMAAAYQRHLSREDVDGIIAFYQSPAGQHLLESQPKMMKEVMPATMQKMQERSKALTASYVKDLKAAMNTDTQPANK